MTIHESDSCLKAVVLDPMGRAAGAYPCLDDAEMWARMSGDGWQARLICVGELSEDDLHRILEAAANLA